MTPPGTAVKKPVQIRFMRFAGGAEAATPVIDWILESGGTARYHEERTDVEGNVHPEYIAIDTLEGTMQASVEDVIIQGVQGEFYPCKPDIFIETNDITEEPA